MRYVRLRVLRMTAARSARPARVRLRALLVAVGVTALVAGFPVAASAHTTLIATSPKEGATVATPPRQVTLTFADRVIQPGIVVRSAAGKRVDGGAEPGGRTVTAPLDKNIAPGHYQVGWRVVAPDGHVQTGTFRFAVPDANGKVPAAPKSSEPTASTGPPVWLWAAIAAAVILVAGGLYAVRRAVR